MVISNISSTLGDVLALMESLHIESIEIDKIKFEGDKTPEDLDSIQRQCDIMFDYIDDNVVQQILRKRITETTAPVTFKSIMRDEFGLTVKFEHWNEDDDMRLFNIRYDENAEVYIAISPGEVSPYTYLISPGDRPLVLRALDKIAAHVKRGSGLFDDLIQYTDTQCEKLLHYSRESTLDKEIFGDLTIPELLDFIFVGYTVDFIQIKPFELLPVSLQETLLGLNLRDNIEEKWSETHVLHKITENVKMRILNEPESVLQAISLRFDHTENLDGEPDHDFIKVLTHTYHALRNVVDLRSEELPEKVYRDENTKDAWVFATMGKPELIDEHYPQFDEDAGIRGVEPIEYLKILEVASKYKGVQEQVKMWAKDPRFD